MGAAPASETGLCEQLRSNLGDELGDLGLECPDLCECSRMRRSSSRAGMTGWTSLAQDYASLSIEEAQHRDVAHFTNWTLRVNPVAARHRRRRLVERAWNDGEL